MIKNQILQGNCIDLMKNIDDSSIDLILCDLPYGVTQNEWDKPIDILELWTQYKRIIKNHGNIVLFGQGKFSAKHICFSEDIYRYSLVWKKNKPRGFLNSKRMPLIAHEDIMVFYKNFGTYNPQKTTGHEPVHAYTHSVLSKNYGETRIGFSGGGSTERFPISVLEFSVVNNEDPEKFHPTQKPLNLAEFLVKSYSNEKDIVLDNCCGSGTFPLAAKLNNRNYIGIELEKSSFDFAKKRLNKYKIH